MNPTSCTVILYILLLQMLYYWYTVDLTKRVRSFLLYCFIVPFTYAVVFHHLFLYQLCLLDILCTYSLVFYIYYLSSCSNSISREQPHHS